MKEINLTRGMKTKVDDEDYEYLNQWKWFAAKHGKFFYACRRMSKKGAYVYMHRLVVGLQNHTKIFADHIDRDSLNNQSSNLRIATRSDNNSNKTCVGASGYLGVFRSSAKKESWFARVIKHGKRNYLGSFNTKEAAAIAYNNAAIKLHGEFANLNIIEN